MAELSPCDKSTIRGWLIGRRCPQWIAATIGCTVADVEACRTYRNFGFCPSPTEIARGAAEVRKSWSPDEHVKRMDCTEVMGYADPDVEARARAYRADRQVARLAAG